MRFAGMADAIRVMGMRFFAKVGALPGERDSTQPIDFDVELDVDTRPAARTDHLSDAVDYASVYATCKRVAQTGSFALLEALASACLDALFSDPRIAAATIRARKPRLLEGATPEVQLTRANPGKAGLRPAENQASDARTH
jgi:dihydroneopterin aldolase